MKVFFLIPRLDYCGPAKQLCLLAAGLERPRFELVVCALHGDGPFAQSLRAAGVRVENLDARHWFDPRPVVRLRALLRGFAPDVAHLWQASTLPLYRLAAGRAAPPTLLSVTAVAQNVAGFVERWLLRDVQRVVVQHPSEASLFRRSGLTEEKVVTIPPGVEMPPETAPAWPAELALPAQGRLLACLGRLEAANGGRDAIWAFDILRFLYDDLRLLLIGEGSERARLVQFAQKLQCEAFLHLAGQRSEGPELLRAADVVWATNRLPGGTNAALEAMARGKPVVATRVGALPDVVVDGETGYLTPVGDKAALARQTRLLLDDPVLRQRLGEAGQQRARGQFSVSELVRRFALLYETLVR